MNDRPTEGAGQGTWAKLRRRKVVQWGLAYAAVAWGLLQGLQYVSDTFGWPREIQQFGTLTLLIGLPFAIVIAWYHGDRGQQRVSASEVVIFTLLLVLGGGFFWWYQRGEDTLTPAAPPAAGASAAAATDSRPSVAVMPFENRSKLEDDSFFVDGVHDDILTQLTKISALKVISRTSVERFRKTDLSRQQIAAQLGVRNILEGGVQRAGGRVRIHVQLIDAATDAHLWAESYDRDLTAANIFELQSEVATAIAGALQASLTTSEQARVRAIPTRSLEAWQAYQIGKQRIAPRTSAALVEAEGHFREAIELDAEFALAWVGLADSLALQTEYASRPRDAGLGEAERAVNRALELDPGLAEAWASAGNIVSSGRQLERAESMLRRAIALNPNYAPAHHWLSFTLLRMGRRDEALAEAERAVVLDPLSAIINNWLGWARMSVGLFDEALAALRQAIEIDSTIANSYSTIGDILAYGFARHDTAIAWQEKAAALDPGNPEYPADLALAHWELRDDAEAARWLARTLAIGEESAYTNFVAALLYVARGDEASARRHAQRTADRGAPFFMFLIRDLDLRKGDYATARARYAKVFPQLLVTGLPKFNFSDGFSAIDLALVLQHTGEGERARELLARSEAFFQNVPRMGPLGYGIADVAIHALRGEKARALARLRDAEQDGWRRRWLYHRDFDPNLASIRDEAEFRAIFADIERDMAQQRARLAARPKDAPPDLGSVR